MEIAVSKIESIERCIARVREEYQDDDENLNNITRQDAIVLNLQRACEQAIDLANLIIAGKRLETPKSSRQGFEILKTNGIIDDELAFGLMKMVGFRNIAVHEYKKISIPILKMLITKDLVLFSNFIEKVKQLMVQDNTW